MIRNLGNCTLATEAKELTSEAEVRALLAMTGDAWLQTTSAVWVRRGSQDWVRVSGTGPDDWRTLPPLDAEVALGDNRSATLRHRGKDWLWVEFTEAEGTTARRVDQQFVSNVALSVLEPQARKQVAAGLNYAVYWQLQAEGADLPSEEQLQVWRPKAARFLGFDQCEIKS
jgi:hypothetical protein